MLLAELESRCVSHDWQMQVAGHGVTKLLDEVQLSGSGGEQIVATNYVGDLLKRIIYNDSQLVGVQAVLSPDNEVTHVLLQLPGDLAQATIVDGDSPIANPGSNRESLIGCVLP